MHRRLKRAVTNAALRPGRVLRETFAAGYGLRDLRADLGAGAVVGVVALPLSMALAIASGVPPQHGLDTAIVAGLVAALLGGSRVQVTGPTAAFVVVLAPIAVLARALPTLRWPDLAAGAATMTVLLAWPRVTRKVPAPLLALVVVSVGCWAAARLFPAFQVETILSRFPAATAGAVGGIPRLPPLPAWPWSFPGADGAPFHLKWDIVRTLAGPAFAIAVLGAIESLLSATVADGMTGDKHDSDAELIGQGLANLTAPFFGGIAATGAIARTATNVRFGARSPLAAAFHALFVLAAVLLLAPLLGHLPMAALAATLLVVAWNMGEFRHVAHVLRVAPRGDVFVLVTCFALTVLFDMVIAVSG